MIEARTFAANLELVEAFAGVEGCVVECGVWRGGMIAAMASVLGPSRNYVLFDSFEGLPQAKEIDGPAALAWQADLSGKAYHDNCRADVSFVHRAMEMAYVTRYEVRAGGFEETLPLFNPDEPIALLRLDGDWYASTMTCLDHLFDKVVPGGIIIVDDYFVWEGCARAVHDFLSKRQASERLRTLGGSVCYMVKG